MKFMVKGVIWLCSGFLLTGCVIPKNIFRHVRPHAKHVKQVEAPPKNCINLGAIKLLDFPEYDDEEYNRDHFIKYATNITGKRGGDTFRVVKRYKTHYAPEGYPKEPYLNGVAQAYRCHNKEGFIPSQELMVNLTYSEPQGCRLLEEESATAIYVDDAEMELRESAVKEKADTVFIYKEEKHYKVGSSRAFYAFYDAYAKLYSCL